MLAARQNARFSLGPKFCAQFKPRVYADFVRGAVHCRGTIATGLALAGDNSSAQRVVDTLVKRYPADTLLTTIDIPAVKAIMSINRYSYDQAVREPEAASRYGGKRHLVLYLRATAYLRGGNAAAAVQEFQKIIDYRFAELGWPGLNALTPLAKLGLARAYAL